ncbi:MAG: SRPBCC family protein [Pirellulales bacterium]
MKTHALSREGKRPADTSDVNVQEVERIGSILLGGGLAIFGAQSRSLSGWLMAAIGGSLVYRGITGHCMLYDRLGINTAQGRGPATAIPAQHGVHVEHSVIIQREAEELYDAWRHFKGLPDFMSHLESVEELDERRSRWTAQGPLGTRISWEAEIINERPGELIAWRSVEGSIIDTAGSVRFDPSGASATQVTVNLKYNPPAGKAGAKLSQLLGADPDQQIVADLQRFKRIMELERARPSVRSDQH